MKCPSCGASSNAKFCAYCGTQLIFPDLKAEHEAALKIAQLQAERDKEKARFDREREQHLTDREELLNQRVQMQKDMEERRAKEALDHERKSLILHIAVYSIGLMSIPMVSIGPIFLAILLRVIFKRYWH